MSTRTWVAVWGLAAALLPAAVAPAQDALDAPVGRGGIRAAGRLGAQAGWALTDAALLVSDDAGVTWSDVAPARDMSSLFDARFLDRALAFGVARDVTGRGTRRLTLVASDDGGRSWREQPIVDSELGPGEAFSGAQVQFVDAERGFVLGRLAMSAAFSRGALWATLDGGLTWRRLPEPPSAGRFVFTDAQRGFQLSADATRLHATTDGGHTWSQLTPVELVRGETARYELPEFTTPLAGRLALHVDGPRPRVLAFVTHDGGRTWRGNDALALDAVAAERSARVDERGRLALAEPGALLLDAAGARRRVRLPGEIGLPALRWAALDVEGRGWALLDEGACDTQGCRQVSRLVAIDVDAPEGAVRTLLARTSAQALPATGEGSTISTGYGFDKCAAATTAQMQAWKTSSPYIDANVYFGGSARSCGQTNLNAAWVSSVFGQGWRLIPTWVGPQSACCNLCSASTPRFSNTASTARAQGLAEADAAADTATALGIGTGSPLYYDMENYNETNATCAAASQAFINAWVERLRARGYIAGVYGAGPDAQHDWIPGVIANSPDAVWIAHWVCTGGTTCNWIPSVWGLYGLSDSYWTNNQRLRQYWGQHDQTFGGVTMSIDSDYAAGPVATSGGSAPYTFTCDNGQTCYSAFGPSQYWHTQTSCGGASLGINGSMIWTYVNGSVISNYARWTPTLSGSGNYVVQVFIPRCYGTSQLAKYKIVANGATYFVTVNQNNVYDAWVTLGTYFFAASGTQYVELADATGEAASTLRQLAFDAVRFTK